MDFDFYFFWHNISVALSVLAVYTPPGQFVLGTTSLPFSHLLGTFFVAAIPTLLLSAIKEMFGVKFL